MRSGSFRATQNNDTKTITDKFDESELVISFYNFKIDYHRCLGKGTFGAVYELAPRPENERGFFSTVFPCHYDKIFPITTQPRESRQFFV